MWQLCSGKFYPVDILDRGQNYDLEFESLTEIKEAVKMQKLAQVCLNDHEHVQNFEQLKAEIIEIFLINLIYHLVSSAKDIKHPES